MDFKCSSKLFRLLAPLGKFLIDLFVTKIIKILTALSNTCRALYKDPTFVCLGLLRQYVELMTSNVFIPFVHYYDTINKEGIPALRPAEGLRRSVTILTHFIAVSRACWWIQVFFHIPQRLEGPRKWESNLGLLSSGSNFPHGCRHDSSLGKNLAAHCAHCLATQFGPSAKPEFRKLVCIN